MLELTNIRYHRNKDVVEISEAQALLMVSDLILVALQQNGFTADIGIKESE